MNDELAKELRHFNVLMEDQNGKLDAVLEYVSEVPKMAHKPDHVEQKVDTLERDMQVVKAAVTATNQDLRKLKSLPAQLTHGHA